MKRIIKRSKIKQKVLHFLKSAGTYYLATMDGDQPRVRPFGTAIFLKENYISKPER